MNEKVSKTDEISKVLFFDWDPIGIKGLVGKDRYDKNSDEYIVYAREIVSRFSEVPNEDEIFDYLKHACQSRMGMGRAKKEWDETRDVAQKVHRLLRGAVASSPPI